MDATPPEGTASRLERLRVLRRLHEDALNGGEVTIRDFASISREYRAVLLDIESLSPPEQKGDAVDEIAQRRSVRRPVAAPGASRSQRPS